MKSIKSVAMTFLGVLLVRLASEFTIVLMYMLTGKMGGDVIMFLMPVLVLCIASLCTIPIVNELATHAEGSAERGDEVTDIVLKEHIKVLVLSGVIGVGLVYISSQFYGVIGDEGATLALIGAYILPYMIGLETVVPKALKRGGYQVGYLTMLNIFTLLLLLSGICLVVGYSSIHAVGLTLGCLALGGVYIALKNKGERAFLGLIK